MSEYTGIVESVDGPTTMCISINVGNQVYPRRVKIKNLIPRDPDACAEWLSQNLVGGFVYILVDRMDKIGNYIADIDFDGKDVATMLIAEGLAD